jgi:RNA polymerase sigma-70 factor (ECF subfamily)
VIFFGKHIDPLLIDSLIKGDVEVLQVVIETSKPKLFDFVVKLVKSRDDAEDILQEVYLRLWMNREQLDLHKSLESYLYTISKRLVIDFYRKASLDRALLDKIIQSSVQYSNETEENIQFKDSFHYFETILESLPPKQRNVFHLAKIEGLSYDAISEELQVSKSTISNHLMEAKKKLRARCFFMSIFFLTVFCLYVI